MRRGLYTLNSTVLRCRLNARIASHVVGLQANCSTREVQRQNLVCGTVCLQTYDVRCNSGHVAEHAGARDVDPDEPPADAPPTFDVGQV